MTPPPQIWDITIPIQPGMPVWPGDPPVVIEPVSSITGGDGCNVSLYHMSSHTGTHIDPPLHFFSDGAPLEEVPLRQMIGSCFVADLTGAETSITPADLEAAEIPPHTERLLLKTRNSELWENPCHAFHPEFIDLSLAGAAWTIDRGIRCVGIDYLSIEGPENPECPVHRSLLSSAVVIIEGLDLREIVSGEYHLLCLPLKTVKGDGAPARVLLQQMS